MTKRNVLFLALLAVSPSDCFVPSVPTPGGTLHQVSTPRASSESTSTYAYRINKSNQESEQPKNNNNELPKESQPKKKRLSKLRNLVKNIPSKKTLAVAAAATALAWRGPVGVEPADAAASIQGGVSIKIDTKSYLNRMQAKKTTPTTVEEKAATAKSATSTTKTLAVVEPAKTMNRAVAAGTVLIATGAGTLFALSSREKAEFEEELATLERTEEILDGIVGAFKENQDNLKYEAQEPDFDYDQDIAKLDKTKRFLANFLEKRGVASWNKKGSSVISPAPLDVVDIVDDAQALAAQEQPNTIELESIIKRAKKVEDRLEWVKAQYNMGVPIPTASSAFLDQLTRGDQTPSAATSYLANLTEKPESGPQSSSSSYLNDLGSSNLRP